MPIRVGIVGLSSSGGWASIAHLPYLRDSTKYQITGLCNSSIQSSQDAIRKYKLDSAHPFDSVEKLCTSDTVDLVVCAVAVFSHYEIAKPVIEAGKDVYVEWPLGVSTAQAHELTQLAKDKGVRTIVGLQGAYSHLQTTLKRVIDAGSIGKPLVTQIFGSACTGETGVKIDKRYGYFKDRDIDGVDGQVMLSIYVGHTFEPLAKLLGEPASVSAQLRTTWLTVDILDGDKVIQSQVEKTADDYASLQGKTKSGVTYTYTLRGGDAFDDGEGLVWDIIGDKGQLRVTGSTIMSNLGAEDYKVRLKEYATGRIEEVSLDRPLDLPLTSQNVGRIYENFASGGAHPTFDDAVRRHQFLDAVFDSASKGGAQVTI
ncbi:related to dehydrogenases and related proteins [Fusarium torulosum]|uniref:Related to dehydrogenases and related proteins n=1 Tax=Fusarium torulosum TaxID=33205 RepID=A0AAE8M0R5_9HYPO|nr:related to dehydrogenases and related proteins [Fusarium torulosum]